MNSSNIKENERNNMYRAFEDRLRGSRELIKKRLEVYLPFILPLKDITTEHKALDLGCGRGEWLELLTENGFDAHGVDLDEGMLKACRERLFSISKQEAVSYLQSMPNQSYVVISAFHLVEHIPFESLQILIQESLRVLKPGGLLILETPNTENLIVNSVKFYLDPTHQRPLPLQLMSFCTDYFGFARTKELRLQEDPNLEKLTELYLIDVLTGVSPDCAIVAQKNASAEFLQAIDEPFAKEYGMTLETLAQRHKTNILLKLSHFEDCVAQAEAKADDAWLHYYTIANSRSWRVTRPLRSMVGVIRQVKKAIKDVVKSVLKPFVIRMSVFVLARPGLKKWAKATAHMFPMIEMRLRRIVLKDIMNIEISEQPTTQSHLTPRARHIYTELKAAIVHHQEEKFDENRH